MPFKICYLQEKNLTKAHITGYYLLQGRVKLICVPDKKAQIKKEFLFNLKH